jgi:hypothetical protein
MAKKNLLFFSYEIFIPRHLLQYHAKKLTRDKKGDKIKELILIGTK